MELVYSFDCIDTPELGAVGGKGQSLIRLTRAGLPVPPGFVLTTEFFRPWFDRIKSLPEWQMALSAPSEELKRYTVALQAAAANLEPDEDHRQVLAAALQELSQEGISLFAVRSSSPEEDLAGASFAGGYETTLAVNKATIWDALRRSFASSLAERVFAYKREHGFRVEQPRIAVIVQAQVAAEKAGVAFSLNPLNNCYDEAVINANFGLGESVVAGTVSPDTFIIDKITGRSLEQKTGQKEISVWLASDGGTYEAAAPSRNEPCLSDGEVQSVVDALRRVEEHYRHPVDIEWALAGERLYLLQARPITAYIPLPTEMRTAPGQPKLLYLDQTLAKQGIQDPISVLGTDLLALFGKKTEQAMMGKSIVDIAQGLQGSLQGRMYLNISNNVKLYGKKKLINTYRLLDAAAAAIIAEMDEAEYVPKQLPPPLRGVIWGTLRNSFGLIVNVFKAYRKPAVYEQRFLEQARVYVKELNELAGNQLPVRHLVETVIDKYISFFLSAMPMLAVTAIAKGGIEKLFRNSNPDLNSKAGFLEKALPNNVTTEMGLSMYRLARFAEVAECPSAEACREKLAAGAFSDGFLDAWNEFMAKYGFRCPKELDIAAPRFYEQPEQFFRQLKAMAGNSDAAHNPQAIFERTRAERESDFAELLREAERRGKAKQFRRYYETLVRYEGYREAPKYYWIMTVARLREKVLAAGTRLTAAGRLDTVNRIFALTLADLERVMSNPSADVRGLAAKNTEFCQQLAGIREFPRVIDSRGKILVPPRKEAAADELAGEPISPGVVRGRVKVLNRPDEKPVLPGEILAAKATDPGWTPLFINAAGVILEIGGALQHGALVAREYGKPCVAGIAVDRLRDGQLVEMDGRHGVVRLLPDD